MLIKKWPHTLADAWGLGNMKNREKFQIIAKYLEHQITILETKQLCLYLFKKNRWELGNISPKGSPGCVQKHLCFSYMEIWLPETHHVYFQDPCCWGWSLHLRRSLLSCHTQRCLHWHLWGHRTPWQWRDTLHGKGVTKAFEDISETMVPALLARHWMLWNERRWTN